MLLNYFKLSIRLLVRDPFFTFINVLGLSVGFAVFYVLLEHATLELKSDQFHTDHDRIYRLYFDLYHNSGTAWVHFLSGAVPPAFTTIIKEKFSEVEDATRVIHQNNFDQVRWAGTQTDTAGWSELDPNVRFSFINKEGVKNTFRETNTVYADPNLFEFFTIPLLKGSAKTVLAKPKAIVLSSSTARKYFGSDNPVGKVIALNDKTSFTVTGVFEDLPDNSHLNFEVVISALNISYAIENIQPFVRSAHTYVKVRDAVPVSKLERRLNEEQKIHWNFDDGFPGSTLTFYLQSLKEVPFRVLDNDVFAPKSKYVARAFSIVAVLVLIMAWINYLNLKLSMQNRRMKEFATRKTAGAARTDFVWQFLIESLVINAIALFAGLTLIQLLKGPLEVLFDFHLPQWDQVTSSSILLFTGTMIFGMALATLQPVFSVWNITTSKILRKKVPTKIPSCTEILTVVQFVISIALIVWLFSVSKQVNHLTRDTWGVDRTNVIVVEMPVSDDNQQFTKPIATLKDNVLSTPGVEDVALSTTVVGDLVDNPIGYNRTDTTEVWVVSKSDGGVDERFIPFYGLRLLAGRNFLPDYPVDKRSVILSRVAAENLGLTPKEAIGKVVNIGKHPWRPFGTKAEVIGVIEEHRYNPLYPESGINNANRGTILTYGEFLFPKNKPLKMSIRLNSRDSRKTIAGIEKMFHDTFEGQLFHWYFLDDHMNVHYKSEGIARNQITLFTAIAIAIACLGLLGLISNKVDEKTKEIGIRKILGAPVVDILEILVNTTVKQLAIAIAVGISLAQHLTQEYLQTFSERITVEWWHFAFPIAIIIVIMFGSVTSVLWKATRSNPVDSLRYE